MEPIDLSEITPIGEAGPVRQEPPYAADGVEDGGEEEEARRARFAIVNGQALGEYSSYKKLLASPDWRMVPYDAAPGISCFELLNFKVEGTNREDVVYAYKASGVVENKSADDIARAHMDCNKISRLCWDTDLSDIGQLEVVNENAALGMALTVQYAEHTPPAITLAAKREFVYFQFSRKTKSTVNKQDNVWVLICRHTDHPARPVKENPVRALSLSVMILTPMTPTKEPYSLNFFSTHVTFMAWAQVGGWIPESVVTLYKTKVADRIKFLRETQFV